MVDIDLLFAGLVFITYFSLFRNFSRFNESLLPFTFESRGDLIKLDRIKNSTDFIDRVIVFSLTKKNDKFQYIYYARKVIIILSVLFVPWFVLVYFMKWYYISTFYWPQFFVSVFLVRTPSLIFTFILDAYARRCK